MSRSSQVCYVAIPFGLKSIGIGRDIDYDEIHARLVGPAAQLAGFQPIRADDFMPMRKQQLELVVRADAMVADVSSANANVFYELGLRHAVRPFGTVLICAAGQARPWDLAGLHVTFYDPDSLETGVEDLVEQLVRIKTADVVDSPIYQLIPGLSVSLPRLDRDIWLRPPSRPDYPDLRQALVDAVREGSRRRVEELEPAVRQQADTDSRLLIDLLLAFRDVGAWDDVLRVARDMPPPEREDERVVQLYALALLRRGDRSDLDHAIQLLQRLVESRPDAGEAWTLLGRAHRERWAATGEPVALDRAIDAYRRAWKLDRDLYAATQLSVLLARRGDQKELQSLLTVAREFAADGLTSGHGDIWRIVTALYLAVLAEDSTDALRLASWVRASSPGQWALETTMRGLEEQAASGADRHLVDAVLEVLHGQRQPERP